MKVIRTVSLVLFVLCSVAFVHAASTFTELSQPCRIIDTRLVIDGLLTNGSPRNFNVSGVTGFEAQGGTPGGCGIPSGSSAAVINFVAVNAQGGGNLRGSAYPNAVPAIGSIINYQLLSPSLNIANGLQFPLCGSPACPLDITIQANGASTQLVADVLGYFSSLDRLVDGGAVLQVINTSDAADSYGIEGRIGTATAGPLSAGVRGLNESTNLFGIGVYGSHNGGGYGVYGTSQTGRGVFGLHVGTSGNEPGVVGETNSTASVAVGVKGQVNTTNAGSGSVGVFGLNQSTNDMGYGVYGEHKGAGYGVFGKAATLGYGVVGQAGAGGFAGRFFGTVSVTGNLNVSGALTKGSGTFLIDHPVIPEEKYLSHSFIESPDMMNVYNGNIVLDALGEAVVELPGYFEALNGDYRYQLTAMGGPAPELHIAEEVEGNRFRIAGGRPGAKVSWQVTGIRQDAYARAHRVDVEREKEPEAKGKYLHPVEHGKSIDQLIGDRLSTPE